MDEKEFVLDWVNEVRGEFGMVPLAELPRGVKGNPFQCVVARALSNGWKANTGACTTTLHKRTIFVHRWKRIEHPPKVRRFIENFDTGVYPELIETS